jgi:hypothetical protein
MQKSGAALLVLFALSRVAVADPETDTVQLDGEIMFSPFLAWFGGSLHYEHRAEGARVGYTVRAGVMPGGFIGDDGNAGFYRVMGAFGLRWHFGNYVYLEGSIGMQAFRFDRYVDDYDIRTGIHYDLAPDLEVAFGARLGPVDISLFTPHFGLGVRLGGAFDL